MGCLKTVEQKAGSLFCRCKFVKFCHSCWLCLAFCTFRANNSNFHCWPVPPSLTWHTLDFCPHAMISPCFFSFSLFPFGFPDMSMLTCVNLYSCSICLSFFSFYPFFSLFDLHIANKMSNNRWLTIMYICIEMPKRRSAIPGCKMQTVVGSWTASQWLHYSLENSAEPVLSWNGIL